MADVNPQTNQAALTRLLAESEWSLLLHCLAGTEATWIEAGPPFARRTARRWPLEDLEKENRPQIDVAGGFELLLLLLSIRRVSIAVRRPKSLGVYEVGTCGPAVAVVVIQWIVPTCRAEEAPGPPNRANLVLSVNRPRLF